MIAFYYVDNAYVQYLKMYDSKVPNINYANNNKFFCGVLLKVNGIDYYAPISHDTTSQRTSIIITDHSKPISSIKLAFMIPVPKKCLTRLDFNQIAKQDINYANLLRAEYEFCRRNVMDIEKKAMKVYRIGCNKNHVLNNVCCDFQLLESKFMSYI